MAFDGISIAQSEHGSAEIQSLRQALHSALQHDDVNGAAKAMVALLERRVEPSSVALSTLARLSSRAAAVLPESLRSAGEPGVEEVLLLLASARGDWTEVDSLAQRLSGLPLCATSLQMVSAQAQEGGRADIVAWAAQRLREQGQSWAMHAIVPLATSLIELGRYSEATALLDSVLHESGPTPLRNQALILRARLKFVIEGADNEALALLNQVSRGRPEHAEADLLATLIRFVKNGSDSLATDLCEAARRRPDLPESNEAYDIAYLVEQLPTEPRLRRGTLESARFELRGRYESAAEGYRMVRSALHPPEGVRIGIREARCWERSGKLERALETWLDLDTEGPEGAVVLIGGGDCLMSLSMADSARSRYMTALERFPDSPHAGRARARLLQ